MVFFDSVVFGYVSTVWYFDMFRQCGILDMFRQCGILDMFRQCGILCFLLDDP